jgi:hypothetical protein
MIADTEGPLDEGYCRVSLEIVWRGSTRAQGQEPFPGVGLKFSKLNRSINGSIVYSEY